MRAKIKISADKDDNMNYYEQVQKAIDYIEQNINVDVELASISREASMSLSGFYRMFYSLTGYTIKDYIRHRRISEACKLMQHSNFSILDIAIMYGFQSNEAFSRAFRRIVGINPSLYRNGKVNEFSFNKIDLLNVYFTDQRKDLIEKYPDIKVLKNISAMRVASHLYYGEEPEHKAISRLVKLANKYKLEDYRIFGYDTSDSLKGEYGYEACITVPEGFECFDNDIIIKTIPGGRYAVTLVDVKEIRNAWKRFANWLLLSPYKQGTHQWLEEHVEGINDDMEYKVQIFLPIA